MKFIEYLQSRSYQTKGRILASVVIVVAIILGTVWFDGIKNNLGGLDTEDLLPKKGSGTVLSSINYLTVESAEEKDGKKYLHFKIENNTSDILNFPNKEQIGLSVHGKNIKPEDVVNRRQQPFVAKVLSKTTNYGTLIFSNFTAEEGDLIINNLYFEQTPANIFSQVIKLDFQKLKPFEELRS